MGKSNAMTVMNKLNHAGIYIGNTGNSQSESTALKIDQNYKRLA